MPKQEDNHIQSTYLKRLKFDPKLLSSIQAKWITNLRIVILLVLTIFLLGLVSFFSLPRRLNPEIKIPIITVATVLPGAGPEDIESLVTIPLENSLRGLTGLTDITSSSLDNVSSIVMQFASTTSQDTAKQEVKDAVDKVTTLPKDAQTPKINALDFENQPIWTFAVSSQSGDVPSLMRFVKELKSRIEDSTKVDHVGLDGFENQEIDVIVSEEKLKQYKINPITLSAAVKAAASSFPAGSIATSRNSYALTIDPQITTVADVRALKLNVAGTIISLGDVADVSLRSELNQKAAYIADQTHGASRVVTFNVFKTSTAKIDEAEKAVQDIVKAENETYQNRFSVTTIQNNADDISKQFTDLLGEFRSTIILVFLCLFLFLGLRQAIISSFTVPLTFLSAFMFMSFVGMSINFLSLFAFLLALGLLVDDTIVTVSAMTTYFKTGKFSPKETGLLVWRDTIIPIWSTTITTIWSFVPLLLSTGIIGEFIKPIPVVVSVTMISSTAIAVLITLPFMMVILKPEIAHRIKVLFAVVSALIALFVVVTIAKGNPFLPVIVLGCLLTIIVLKWAGGLILKSIRQPKNYAVLTNKIPKQVRDDSGVWIKKVSSWIKKTSDRGIIDVEPFAAAYHRLMLRILNSKSARRTVVILIVIYAVGAFMLLPLGLVKNEFFPKTDTDLIGVTVELPAGTTLTRSNAEALNLLEQLRKTQLAQFVVAEVGVIPSNGFSAGGESNNNIDFTIHLPPKDTRKITVFDIAAKLREQFKSYTTGTLTVSEQSGGGPPAGADLNLKILGDDLGELTKIADQLSEYLKKQPGVTDVQKSIKPGTSAVTFVPNTQKLAQNGLSVDGIGLWLRTYASGFTLDSVNFDKTSTEQTDIVIKFSSEIPTISELSTIQIPTPTGGFQPLSALGDFVIQANPTVITRESGKRTMAVSAAVTQGYSVTDKNKQLVDYASSLSIPPGYSFQTGGVNEENQKSVTSILQAMIVAFILILVTMVIQFGSYRQAVLVLLVIPLAVSSVFVAFALTGTPLSFPALIGVLSLFGIVVTNSMFIVDKINLNLKQGMEFKEAIADAGSSRMEPIILTKLCTVFGLLPITLAEPLWRGLGGAIISGLLVASTIMLLFIPVVYYSWFNGEKK